MPENQTTETDPSAEGDGKENTGKGKKESGGEDTISIPSTFEDVEVLSTDNTTIQEIPLPAVQKAGFKLAIFILFIISGFLLFLVIILFTKKFEASDCINLSSFSANDTIFQHQKDMIQTMQAEKKSYRDFISSMSQMVLLNLLLPTLTAILGYIFGSREGRTASGSSGG